MGRRVVVALGLLGLMACSGERRVHLSLPPEVLTGRIQTLLLSFEVGNARETRVLELITAPSTAAPVSEPLSLSEAPLFVTLLASEHSLSELNIDPDRLRVPGPAEALRPPLMAELAFSAQLDVDSPSWTPEADAVVAATRVRIADDNGPSNNCERITLDEQNVPAPDVDLFSVVVLPDGSVLFGGGAQTTGAVGLLFPNREIEMVPIDPGLGRVSKLVAGPPGVAYGTTQTGWLFELDVAARRVVQSSSSPSHHDMALKEDGTLLVWGELSPVEHLDQNLNVLDVRHDFPRPVLELLPLDGERLLVMSSTAVFHYDGTRWTSELCCSDFGVGLRSLSHLGEEALAAVDQRIWTRNPERATWRPLPLPISEVSVHATAFLKSGQILVGASVGVLELWEEPARCKIDNNVKRAFNALDVDRSRGLFYAVTWFTGAGGVPAIVRGTFPP